MEFLNGIGHSFPRVLQPAICHNHVYIGNGFDCFVLGACILAFGYMLGTDRYIPDDEAITICGLVMYTYFRMSKPLQVVRYVCGGVLVNNSVNNQVADDDNLERCEAINSTKMSVFTHATKVGNACFETNKYVIQDK